MKIKSAWLLIGFLLNTFSMVFAFNEQDLVRFGYAPLTKENSNELAKSAAKELDKWKENAKNIQKKYGPLAVKQFLNDLMFFSVEAQKNEEICACLRFFINNDIYDIHNATRKVYEGNPAVKNVLEFGNMAEFAKLLKNDILKHENDLKNLFLIIESNDGEKRFNDFIAKLAKFDGISKVYEDAFDDFKFKTIKDVIDHVFFEFIDNVKHYKSAENLASFLDGLLITEAFRVFRTTKTSENPSGLEMTILKELNKALSRYEEKYFFGVDVIDNQSFNLKEYALARNNLIAEQLKEHIVFKDFLRRKLYVDVKCVCNSNYEDFISYKSFDDVSKLHETIIQFIKDFSPEVAKEHEEFIGKARSLFPPRHLPKTILAELKEHKNWTDGFDKWVRPPEEYDAPFYSESLSAQTSDASTSVNDEPYAKDGYSGSQSERSEGFVSVRKRIERFSRSFSSSESFRSPSRPRAGTGSRAISVSLNRSNEIAKSPGTFRAKFHQGSEQAAAPSVSGTQTEPETVIEKIPKLNLEKLKNENNTVKSSKTISNRSSHSKKKNHSSRSGKKDKKNEDQEVGKSKHKHAKKSSRKNADKSASKKFSHSSRHQTEEKSEIISPFSNRKHYKEGTSEVISPRSKSRHHKEGTSEVISPRSKSRHHKEEKSEVVSPRSKSRHHKEEKSEIISPRSQNKHDKSDKDVTFSLIENAPQEKENISSNEPESVRLPEKIKHGHRKAKSATDASEIPIIKELSKSDNKEFENDAYLQNLSRIKKGHRKTKSDTHTPSIIHINQIDLKKTQLELPNLGKKEARKSKNSQTKTKSETGTEEEISVDSKMERKKSEPAITRLKKSLGTSLEADGAVVTKRKTSKGKDSLDK